MGGKSEKMRGAEVRASRARSRVEARKRTRGKNRKKLNVPVAGGTSLYDQAAGDAAAPAANRTDDVSRKPAPAEGGKADAEEAGHKKERSAAHVRTALLGALLVGSLGALLWIYTGTGVLNVRHVEIRGNEILQEGYLRTLSGITSDTHLLKMNVKAVEKALTSEPCIAAVDVSRHFPHTVVIEVKERRPSGAILQNGRYNIVDQEGMVLASSESMPAGIVEIRDLQLPLLLPGTELKGADFASVTSLLGSLPPALLEKTSVVGLRKDEGLYLEAGGTLVIYGEVRDLSRKNEIAIMALESLVGRYGAVEYIDVSFPDHPVIKPAGAV
ncbi:MAG: FtsQ-type POTRA domain-containing protein [Actinomycetota bacterium]|nr:FtsQ-type POTRA domain-containing protein [Actinomycetota bacterium]